MAKKMISAVISTELIDLKRETGAKWEFIIKKGLENLNTAKMTSVLVDEYKKLEEKQRRTAELLRKYADLVPKEEVD